jgi:predicted AlkP superfamily pyrophosphatase or phosphodiesterase
MFMAFGGKVAKNLWAFQAFLRQEMRGLSYFCTKTTFILKYILSLTVVLCNAFAYANSDTLRYEIPGRKNADLTKPYVILISADGFRPDYIEKFNAVNLRKLADQGVESAGMVPSYPSNTFPNHYTLVTGMYPSRNGLIDNSFYDPHRRALYDMYNAKVVRDSSWYGGVPLWSLAERNGVLSGSLFWVASESRTLGVPPTYYYHYHSQFTNDRKIAIIKEMLSFPEEKRPHFLTLYFPEVDSQGHHYGPDSPENRAAVLEVDRAVGKLQEEVASLGLKNVNYVFVSDHGMLQSDLAHKLHIPESVLNEDHVVINSYTMVRIHVLDKSKVKAKYRELKSAKNPYYSVVLTKRMPRRLHFRKNADDRLGDIVLLPHAPKTFESIPPPKRPYPGVHGYDPKKVPEMNATFLAWGPAFKQGYKIGTFKNVHVYPLIADVLGLTYDHKIDGKTKVLKKVKAGN